MMAIEMSGSVYCPLSPRDPAERLHLLVKETKARVVLVHWLTNLKLANSVPSVSIDEIINAEETLTDAVVNRILACSVSSKNVAYAIFTSGSTGTPKAVS